MFCSKCGEQIPEGVGRCPACGAVQQAEATTVSGVTAPEQRYNPLAITGFVLACSGIVVLPMVIWCELAGLIISIIALSKFKSGNRDKGRGLALAGLIISISVLFILLMVILVFGLTVLTTLA
ncbi:MAG: zinc ribbon domain-containing protein [Clostridia bacterium]|nr:zinc ribbon domain-containing protein [Clostridia bacterium]